MKIITKIIIVILLIMLPKDESLFAQTPATATAPEWNKNLNRTFNNSGVYVPHKFGTFDNSALNIFTNGTQKATILSNGNFGIGTLSPASLLHVSDGTNATYTQIANTATGTTAGDGFKIGVSATGGIAEIRQQENAAINEFFNQ